MIGALDLNTLVGIAVVAFVVGDAVFTGALLLVVVGSVDFAGALLAMVVGNTNNEYFYEM